jgi:hypothetical protein
MKLSLTAIAALSAAFFHPTVATGTRAASSNGNTNAAEAKPDRNLEFLPDLEDVAAVFEAIGEKLEVVDEFIDGVIEDTTDVLITKAQSILFLKLMVADQIATCMAWAYGTDIGSGTHGIPMDWLMSVAESMLAYVGDMSAWDADQDEYLIASEMAPRFAVLNHEVLTKFAGAMDSTCAFAGQVRVGVGRA